MTQERSDQEFCVKKGALKKLAGNAKCFAKERLIGKEQTLAHTVGKLNTELNAQMRVKLFLIDK